MSAALHRTSWHGTTMSYVALLRTVLLLNLICVAVGLEQRCVCIDVTTCVSCPSRVTCAVIVIVVAVEHCIGRAVGRHLLQRGAAKD